MIRIAAVGDVHFGADSAGTLRPHLSRLADQADVLLIAGDLTRVGSTDEAKILASELDEVGVPVVAVLGNHDHHADQQEAVTEVLERAGIRVLEGQSAVIELADGDRLGVAGAKGFGGGFMGACGSDFGERAMKAFIESTKASADSLETALRGLDTERRIALLHYSPVEATLRGERPEIYPFLGSYLLAEAIDRAGADLVIHGHAHHGAEKGVTVGGIPVRNVAQPLIGRAYNLYCLDGGSEPLSEAELSSAPEAR